MAMASSSSVTGQVGRNRSFEGAETYQAEAIDPRDLARIVEEAIAGGLDRSAYKTMLEAEAKARSGVISRLGL
jgi:hypothetical protein